MTKPAYFLAATLVALGLPSTVSALPPTIRCANSKVGPIACENPPLASCYRVAIVGHRIPYVDHLDPVTRAQMSLTLGHMPKSLFGFAPFYAGSLGRIYAARLMNASMNTPDTGFMVWSSHYGLVLSTVGNGDFWLGSTKIGGVPAIVVGEASRKIINESGEHAPAPSAVFQWSPVKHEYMRQKCTRLENK